MKNSFFLFDGKYYEQTEGLGMGLPLGPTFANIFMSFHEQNWLANCPSHFKPVFYNRYIDDTFLLFRDQSHCSLFFNYLNQQHSSIKFTVETESNNSLPFLDCKVERCGDQFSTSVFRKSSFSGLTMSFFSSCCKRFKLNSVKTLIYRAYTICSSYVSLHSEFQFITDMFFQNGFPKSLIQNSINKFLNSKYHQNCPAISVPKKPIYFSNLYFGHKSVEFNIKIRELVSEYFPHVQLHSVLVNPFNIGSLFPFKDSLPMSLRSRVVYKYSCERVNCPSVYYGSTIRALSARVAEHRGVSPRTGHLLITPPHSAVRDHAQNCNSDLSSENFKIVSSNSSVISLRILESLFIVDNKPDLNDTKSAFPLKVVNN